MSMFPFGGRVMLEEAITSQPLLYLSTSISMNQDSTFSTHNSSIRQNPINLSSVINQSSKINITHNITTPANSPRTTRDTILLEPGSQLNKINHHNISEPSIAEGYIYNSKNRNEILATIYRIKQKGVSLRSLIVYTRVVKCQQLIYRLLDCINLNIIVFDRYTFTLYFYFQTHIKIR